MTYNGIMELETVLKAVEGAAGSSQFNRDPLHYHLSFFGTPGPDAAWGWRLEGHHISLNFTVSKGRLLRAAPTFAGTNPAEVKDGKRRYAMRYCGPMGCTESDDMENWNYAYPASKGAVAQTLDYPFLQGMGKAQPNERYPGFTTIDHTYAEENQRVRLRRWLEFMEARSWDDLFPVKK